MLEAAAGGRSLQAPQLRPLSGQVTHRLKKGTELWHMTANTQPCPTSPLSACAISGYWAQGLPAAQLRRCIVRPAWLSKETTAWLECEKVVHGMGKMDRLQRRNWDILPGLVGSASIVSETKNQLEGRHARGVRESKKSFYGSISTKRLTKENAGLLQHGVGDTVTADPHHLFLLPSERSARTPA